MVFKRILVDDLYVGPSVAAHVLAVAPGPSLRDD